jgi:hypothetical protein
MDTYVSKEHTASIFRTAVSWVKVWLVCMGRWQWGGGVTLTNRRGNLEPNHILILPTVILMMEEASVPLRHHIHVHSYMVVIPQNIP